MPKYKNLKPEIIEGFLDAMFGKVATKAAEKTIKDIEKKDPKLGKLLKIANDVAKKGERHLKSMSKSERDDYMDNLRRDLGV